MVYLSCPIYFNSPNLHSSLQMNTLFTKEHGDERAICKVGGSQLLDVCAPQIEQILEMKMRLSKYMRLAALLAALALLLPTLISAQSVVTGAISGSITDPSGAVIVGATVNLKNNATGELLTTTSGSGGTFQFTLLKPGVYVVSATQTGFKQVTETVEVLLGQTASANMKLELGTGAVTVEVTGQGAMLQTEDANIASNFDTNSIQNIPNPGGDITYVAQTAPGVTMNNSTGGGYGNFSAFGLPATSNLFTINGNDYNDAFLNLNNSGSSNLLLGGNELQEVAVVSNAYTGQYGRQAGAQVDYSTKSGGNAFHGDAVYNWTGRELTANDPVNKFFGGTRPFENNNQWAAALGGPIIKDKLFFFVNTEGIRYIFGAVHTPAVPTPAFETYVLGNVPQDAGTQAFYNNAFSLYNAAPGIANAVPNGLPTAFSPTNPQGPGSCAGFPFVTNPDGSTTFTTLPSSFSNGGANPGECTESFTQSVSSGNKEWLVSGRVDYNLGENDKIFGRVRFDRGTQPTYTDSINPTFNDFSIQPQDEGQLNYTHIFSPNVVNNFIFSTLYYSAIFGNLNPAPSLALFPGNLAFTVDGSLTALGTGSGNPGGFAQGFLYPSGRKVEQWGLVDDLSITRGNHGFKMGINFRRDDITDYTAANLTLYPVINATLFGFANDQVAPSGCATQANQQVGCGSVLYNFANSDRQPVAYYSVGAYFQDEYRVNSRLKFTLTLRADRNSGGTCNSNCSSLPFTPFNDMPHGMTIPYDQSFQTGRKDIIPGVEKIVFEPRFGVAWSPFGQNTVVRAGVGLFSDLYPGFILSEFDTNFPQVNLFNVPTGTIAFDGLPPGTTAFQTSGPTLVAQCNAAFTSNFLSGGSLTTAGASGAGYSGAASGIPGGCLNAQGNLSVPTLTDVSRNLKNPKYVEWNLEIQHTFGARTVVSANYVGNHGYDGLVQNPDLNGFGFGSLPAQPTDPRVGRVNFLYNGGVSNYNGVTFSIRENTWHGLSGRLNYTYSHALDDLSNGGLEPFSAITSIFLSQVDPFDLSKQYASGDNDARHQITASYIYELPFKSEKRLVNAAIGGWMISGTWFYRTGFPFSIFDGGESGALAGQNLSGSTILLQPVPTFTRRNFGNVSNCIGTPCFVNGGPNSDFEPSTDFTGSVVGRNAFRAPGFLGGDLSVRKNFQINERVTFQLALNAYNWLNHANYGAPYPSTNNSIFGLAVITQTPPTSPYGAFAAAATDQRIAQITGKLIF
jgi:Carboxypeptidase regulatory-like domain/TonB-dependent Receptor Plug Domain